MVLIVDYYNSLPFWIIELNTPEKFLISLQLLILRLTIYWPLLRLIIWFHKIHLFVYHLDPSFPLVFLVNQTVYSMGVQKALNYCSFETLYCLDSTNELLDRFIHYWSNFYLYLYLSYSYSMYFLWKFENYSRFHYLNYQYFLWKYNSDALHKYFVYLLRFKVSHIDFY